MTYAGWIFGLLGFGMFGGLCWWLIHTGKKIKEAEYDREKVILLEKHQRSINNWAMENDRLTTEANRLKEELRVAPSLAVVLKLLNEARGDEVSHAGKSDSA